MGPDSDSDVESIPLSLAIQLEPINPTIRILKERFNGTSDPPTMQRLLKAGWISIVPLMPLNVERSLPLLMEWHDPGMNPSLLSLLPALSTSKSHS